MPTFPLFALRLRAATMVKACSGGDAPVAEELDA
jgi:hypothetical protein